MRTPTVGLAKVLATVLVAALGWSLLHAAPQHASHLLVSLSGADAVALFDVQTGEQVTRFATAQGPHEIATSPDGRFAYVAAAGAQHVTAISLVERTSRAFDLTPHRQPHDIRVSPDGRRLWVAVAPSRAILEIDATTGRTLRVLPLDRDGAWFVTATPDGRTLFVPHLEGKAISSIDLTSGSSRVVVEGGAFSGAAVSPDGRELWAIEHEASRIVVISTSTSAVVHRVPLDAAVFGRLAFSPDGDRVFVVQGKALIALDARSRRATARLDMPLEGKVIALSPDGAHAAISNPAASRVTIVDLSRLRVERTIEAGPTPDGVAWIRFHGAEDAR